MDTQTRPRRRLSKTERRNQLLACAVNVAAHNGFARLFHVRAYAASVDSRREEPVAD